MSLDWQEQQQMSALKTFWSRWGKWVISVIIGLVICYAVFRGYLYYQVQQAEKAAVVYDELVKVAQLKQLAKIKPLISKLEADYSSTPYASGGALLAARVAFDLNDLAYSRAQLQWVIAHTTELAVKSIARLRLASVLLDQKDYRHAMSELAQEHDAVFDGLFLDLKGDIYAAKGDRAAAQKAWKAALAKIQDDRPERQLIEIKLDAAGG